MELVYLWVESYKNIRNQGFNFSPRFECEFDGENLTITENKDYVSIFPDNINVTAIVGENGSGKSSISELLVDFSYQEFHDEKTFLVFFDNTFTFKQSYTGNKVDFSIINKTNYTYDDKNDSRTVSCIYFSNDVATFFNNPKFHYHSIHSNLDAFYNYNTKLMKNNKYSYSTSEQINKLETFNIRFKNLLEMDKNILIDINKNLIFDSFRRELHFYELGVSFVTNENIFRLLNKPKLEGITIFDEPKLKNINTYFFKLIILFRLSTIDKKNEENIIKEIEENFNKQNITLKKCLKILNTFDKFDSQKDIYTKKNIKDILEKYQYNATEIWIEKEIQEIDKNINTSNKLLNLLFSVLGRIDFLNKLSPDYNYFSLSSGEREYIKTFIALIHHLKNASQEFIFIFDEIELGLHPNWQKNLIKDFVNIVSKYINKNMNFIFTSHSPFILSDLPKEHVIFLEKYDEKDNEVKNGNQKVANCKNATKDIELKTFGANIHTLLSNGFFMNDGLMGEFAKSKINEIKDFYDANKNLKKDDSDFESKKDEFEEKKKYFENIQKIIGEPFLQTIIKNYLDELEILFNGKKEFLDKEMKRLESLKKSLDD
jgi:predicted ATP-binding protein involved in virulence